MASIIVQGGPPLQGEVRISGAKNSALALIVAAALAKSPARLENVPHGTDITTILQILEELGAKSRWDGDILEINGEGIRNYQAPYELVRKMRASFYVAGLLLARLGKAEIPLPGGCALGSRPVDFHIKGFQSLGAEVGIEHGFMKAETSCLRGSKIFVNRASVGVTINMMLAASLAEGQTVLENAAREPEVVDLAIFLNAMGAKIRGAGTDVIRIEGVKELRGVEYGIIPDRIEAGTYLLAGAITRGDLQVTEVVPEHLRPLMLKLEEVGFLVEEGATWVRVAYQGVIRSVDIQTAPYPGFPTDLQQPFGTLMSLADGTSVIRETIFDNRFRYVDELRRMGADIKVERDTAIIRGVEKLTGAPVEATDLRAGASLVIAGLVAEGSTEVSGVEHIDRGYERMTEKLVAIGGKIQRKE